jgi:GNAT superfamily N-acetyltransferase
MISFDLVPFQADLEEPFARLFRQEGFDRDAPYVRWAFQSPHGRGLVARARDLEAGGKSVGILGLLPTRLCCQGKPLAAHLAIDLVVDPDYRGRGIFTGLGEIALSGAAASGSALVWGFPNQAAAHAWFGRFGWIKLGSVPLMMRPLRSGFLFGRLGLSLGRIDLPLGPVRARPVKGVRLLASFGEETDALWRSFAKRIGCCVVRDAERLNWRLVERPGAEYRTVGAFDAGGSLLALVSSKTEARLDGHFLYIMEAMSRGEAEDRILSNLLRHEVAIAAGKGVDAALCWCLPKSPNYRAYRRAGFWRVPERFRPTQSYFGVKPLGDVPHEALSDGWYVSFLDLDTL